MGCRVYPRALGRAATLVIYFLYITPICNYIYQIACFEGECFPFLLQYRLPNPSLQPSHVNSRPLYYALVAHYLSPSIIMRILIDSLNNRYAFVGRAMRPNHPCHATLSLARPRVIVTSFLAIFGEVRLPLSLKPPLACGVCAEVL